MEDMGNSALAFRNFNLCPHCQSLGDRTLLCRLCEGLPMISRSDGNSFHLLLADRPVPYPNERSAGPSNKISVCFWYSHVSRPRITRCTVVTLRSKQTNRPRVFRTIEAVADLLAQVLVHRGELHQFYDFSGSSLFEVAI